MISVTSFRSYNLCGGCWATTISMDVVWLQRSPWRLFDDDHCGGCLATTVSVEVVWFQRSPWRLFEPKNLRRGGLIEEEEEGGGGGGGTRSLDATPKPQPGRPQTEGNRRGAVEGKCCHGCTGQVTDSGEKVKVCEFSEGHHFGDLEFINNHTTVTDVVAAGSVSCVKLNRYHIELCMVCPALTSLPHARCSPFVRPLGPHSPLGCGGHWWLPAFSSANHQPPAVDCCDRSSNCRR